MFYTGDIEGNELQVYYGGGGDWPWDIGWDAVGSPSAPFTRLNNKPTGIDIIEQTAEKATVLITREWEGSTFAQFITLTNGSDKVDVHFEVSWAMANHTLKLAFPVKADADKATYEVAYGAFQRSTVRETAWDRARFEQSWGISGWT